MIIYLVRHGQSTNNAHQPHVADPPLTTLGREQAQFTARALSERALGPATLYVSPMRRALETARTIGAALALPLNVFPVLCESGGLRTERGLCRHEIIRDYPDATLDRTVTDTGWWTPNPDEEPDESVFVRANAALTMLRARHGSAETVIIVTHGTFGRILLTILLGLAPDSGAQFPLYNCAITRLDLAPRYGGANIITPAVSSETTNAAIPSVPSETSEVAILQFHNVVSHLPASHLT